MSLNEELRNVPDDVFWRKNPQGVLVPAYNIIFAWLMRQTKAYSKVYWFNVNENFHLLL